MLRAALVSAISMGALAIGCAATPPPPPSPPPAPSGGACAAGAADPLCAMTDEQLARKMLEVTGSANLGKHVGESLLDSFSKMKDVPPGVIERLKKNIRAEELTELIVPIYLKHYKRETMIAAIRFYQSPEGSQLIDALPVVTEESMAAGRVWGKRIAEKTLKDLQTTGREQ